MAARLERRAWSATGAAPASGASTRTVPRQREAPSSTTTRVPANPGGEPPARKAGRPNSPGRLGRPGSAPAVPAIGRRPRQRRAPETGVPARVPTSGRRYRARADPERRRNREFSPAGRTKAGPTRASTGLEHEEVPASESPPGGADVQPVPCSFPQDTGRAAAKLPSRGAGDLPRPGTRRAPRARPGVALGVPCSARIARRQTSASPRTSSARRLPAANNPSKN